MLSDLHSFAASADGALSEAVSVPTSWWTVIACMASIATIKLSLARLGFARTLKRVRVRSEHLMSTTAVPLECIARADHVVAVAAALYPGRALCLERSLVLYDWLRRAGADVELLIGVQATPFKAHAWVTYDGRPVNDSAEHVSHFVVVPPVFS